MSQHAGFAAIIGAPNAGKSTLVNALVGTKVAIVSPKVQTTRMPVRGVAVKDETQVVFVDTPGIFKPRRRLDRAMVTSAWTHAGDADAVVLLVDAQELTANPKGRAADDTHAIIKALKDDGRKAALALNKIDGMKRTDLLPLVQALTAENTFEQVFMISALKGDGVADLFTWVQGKMPEGPWLYPEDQAADIPSRLLAAEITREQLFLRLYEELPHAVAVETEDWEEFKNGSVKVSQVIYVERDSQRAIVLGKGGATIKAIGAASRQELQELLGRTVHLALRVKPRADWAESRELYRDWGLEWNA